MLKQELAFIKAVSTLQVTPALLKELKTALSTRKRTVMPAGIRGRAPGGGPRTTQRPPSRLTGKRKANELANSGDSMEPAIRRPAPDAVSAPLHAKPSPTSEQAVNSSRQLGPPEGGSTYAAVLAGSAAPIHPSGTLKPTAMDSDPSESAVSTETATRRMSYDMSGPLSGTPAGTTSTPRWPPSVPQQESVPIRRPFLFQASATPEPSWLGCGHPASAD